MLHNSEKWDFFQGLGEFLWEAIVFERNKNRYSQQVCKDIPLTVCL